MAAADLRLDGESAVERSTCSECGADYLLVKSFFLDEAGPYAISFSALHWHGEAEAWIDVIFGAFEGEAADDDRTTFGCRVGRVEGSDEPAATAVVAAVPYSDGPVFGHKLSRDEALAHPRIADFWRVVDFLLQHEPAVAHHVHDHLGGATRSRRRWWRRS
jgi:hypothetical protein